MRNTRQRREMKKRALKTGSKKQASDEWLDES
jgi:hypothetical protein